MRNKLAIAIVVVLALALTACGDLETTSTDNEQEEATQEEISEAPEPTEEEEVAAEGEYGSDPRLDRLYDECEDGDSESCAELFWDAPVDSEYEDFALDNGKLAEMEAANPNNEDSGSSSVTFSWTDLTVGCDFVDDYELTGRVTNESNENFDGVIWKATLFDASGSIVGTADASAQGLAPGQTKTIEFISMDSCAPDVDDVEIQTDMSY